MRALFRKKFRVVTLVSLAFLTQCCCIVIPFSVEAQQQMQQAAVEQQAVVDRQVAVERQTIVDQIVNRIEAAAAFDR